MISRLHVIFIQTEFSFQCFLNTWHDVTQDVISGYLVHFRYKVSK